MIDETRQDVDEAAQDEAIAWYVRLKDPSASAEDRAGFEAWLQQDACHWQAYQQVKHLWQDLAEPAQVLGQGQWYRPKRRFSRQRLSAVAMAASLVLMVSLLAVWWQDPGFLQRMQADYATRQGQQAEFVLADGSRIYLDADTAVKVDFSTEARRRVELLRGRAWFDVTPDATRPFEVQQGPMQVEVLGTAFTLTHYESGKAVLVEEGLVQVRLAGSQEILGPLQIGDYLDYPADGQPRITQQDPEIMQAWRKGVYVFDQEPLDKVLQMLEANFNGRLLVQSELRSLPVTGVFRQQQLDVSLQALVSSLNLKTRRIPGVGVWIYR